MNENIFTRKFLTQKFCEQANYSIMIRAHAPVATYTAAGYIHCVDFHLHMPICAQGHMKHMVSYNSTGWSTKKIMLLDCIKQFKANKPVFHGLAEFKLHSITHISRTDYLCAGRTCIQVLEYQSLMS